MGILFKEKPMRHQICTLFLLPSACAVFAAPVPKDSWKKHGWERPVNPDKDCKFDIKDGIVTIELPGGDHELAPKRNRFNAPRILRDIEGDFIMQVRVCASFRPSAESAVKRKDLEFPNHPNVAAGLVLIPTDKNYIRLEYKAYISRGEQSNVPAFQIRGEKIWNMYEDGWGLPWQEQIRKGKEDRIYLRLDRRGNTIYRFLSPDGEKWYAGSDTKWYADDGTDNGTVSVKFSVLPAKIKVGLAAYSTTTEPFKVCFDEFKLIRGRQKSK